MVSAFLAFAILTVALLVLQSSDDSGKGGGRRQLAPVRVRTNQPRTERRRYR